MSNYSVTAYLVLLIASSVFTTCSSLYLKARNVRRAFPQLMLMRSCAELAINLTLFYFFRVGLIGNWTTVISACILNLLTIYAYVLIRQRRLKAANAIAANGLVEISEQEKWVEVRARGKQRYLLINTALYGAAGLWMMILCKIILLDEFPMYLFASIVIASAIGGGVSALRQWNHNEQTYQLEHSSSDRLA